MFYKKAECHCNSPRCCRRSSENRNFGRTTRKKFLCDPKIDKLVQTDGRDTVSYPLGCPRLATSARRRRRRMPRRTAPGLSTARCVALSKVMVGKISARCCSFSAVSAPIFARKYAFCSIFQNLPDSQAEIFEI